LTRRELPLVFTTPLYLMSLTFLLHRCSCCRPVVFGPTKRIQSRWWWPTGPKLGVLYGLKLPPPNYGKNWSDTNI